MAILEVETLGVWPQPGLKSDHPRCHSCLLVSGGGEVRMGPLHSLPCLLILFGSVLLTETQPYGPRHPVQFCSQRLESLTL